MCLDGFIAVLSKCIYDFSSPAFDDDLTSCFFVLQLIYFIFSFVHKQIYHLNVSVSEPIVTAAL